MSRATRGLSRRAFVRAAVAIGGASALAACIDREADDDLPRANVEPHDLPERQHAWNEYLRTDDHGNDLPPKHHLLVHLEYVGDGLGGGSRERVDRDELDAVEAAFRTLERAYERGNEGLAFTVGYAPAYFDRFDTALPDDLGLEPPRALASIEDPDLDSYDAMVHLASDHGSVLLAAEEALKGDLGELNGIDVEGSLDGIFSIEERRTGFVGEGLPAENQSDLRGIPDSEPVPEESPLFMGFTSGLKGTQASEERVTIESGAFEGGTTTHLSRIRLQLEQWYEQDSRDQRVAKMFCPMHAQEDRVEGVGENLGSDTELGECPDRALEDARTEGLVGHAQKAARAREDGRPIILRRDFDSTDDDEAGVHFLSHQRSVEDFVATREAMTGGDLAEASAIGSRVNNGILQYLAVRSRANYLVPPRRHRSLPTPDPS